jgi:hypothetical protein
MPCLLLWATGLVRLRRRAPSLLWIEWMGSASSRGRRPTQSMCSVQFHESAENLYPAERRAVSSPTPMTVDAAQTSRSSCSLVGFLSTSSRAEEHRFGTRTFPESIKQPQILERHNHSRLTRLFFDHKYGSQVVSHTICRHLEAVLRNAAPGIHFGMYRTGFMRSLYHATGGNHSHMGNKSTTHAPGAVEALKFAIAVNDDVKKGSFSSLR